MVFQWYFNDFSVLRGLSWQCHSTKISLKIANTSEIITESCWNYTEISGNFSVTHFSVTLGFSVIFSVIIFPYMFANADKYGAI